MSTDDDAKWLTKREAAERIGIGVRQIEKYAAKGKLDGGKRTGKFGPEAVFTIESVDRLKEELNAKPSDVIYNPPSALAVRGSSAPLISGLEALTEAMKAHARLLTQASSKAPDVRIADKLTLSLREAAALTGYSREYLLEAIHSGALSAAQRSRKWNIKRSDLDDWLKSL